MHFAQHNRTFLPLCSNAIYSIRCSRTQIFPSNSSIPSSCCPWGQSRPHLNLEFYPLISHQTRLLGQIGYCHTKKTNYEVLSLRTAENVKMWPIIFDSTFLTFKAKFSVGAPKLRLDFEDTILNAEWNSVAPKLRQGFEETILNAEWCIHVTFTVLNVIPPITTNHPCMGPS